MIPKILRAYNSYKHTYTCDVLISRFRFSIKFLSKEHAENDSGQLFKVYHWINDGVIMPYNATFIHEYLNSA
jgi:hypothetical protein